MPGMRRRTTVLGMATLTLSMLAPASAALAQPGDACDNRSNNTYQMLLECVTVEGVREHQAEFQKIADNSMDPVYPGTRAAGTLGYADSVDYVAGLLEDAGYEVTLDPVQITFNFPPVLSQLTPACSPAAAPVTCRHRSPRSTSISCHRGRARVVATEPSRRRPLAHRSWQTPAVPTTSPASPPAPSH